MAEFTSNDRDIVYVKLEPGGDDGGGGNGGGKGKPKK